MENKYGLSRNIPAPIKRKVRQICGFGCIVCGLGIVDYEHIDPPFAEAKEHRVEGIILLCPRCHGKFTRNFLSRETIIEAIKKPFCKKYGYARELLDIGKRNPMIIIGGSQFSDCEMPIAYDNIPIIEVKEAEESGGPFRISATFYNSMGDLSLIILDNEWKAFSGNWDIESVGGSIIIRENPRHVSLKLKSEPPNNVIIQKLDMFLLGWRIIANPEELVLINPSGGRIVVKELRVINCKGGINLSNI
jgi:hypothetical protein